MITLACPTTVANFPSKRNPIKSKKSFMKTFLSGKLGKVSKKNKKSAEFSAKKKYGPKMHKIT